MSVSASLMAGQPKSELDEAFTRRLQEFIWRAALNNPSWKPYDGARWTQEDNNACLGYGFMLLLGLHGRYDLHTLGRGVSVDAIFEVIHTMAAICPFCAKAAAILVSQKLADRGQTT